MKKICFIAVLFLSNIVLSSHQELPTSLVVDVDNFLKQFEVARAFKESKDDFLKRVRESKKFESVIYVEYSERFFQKDINSKIDDGKKQYLLRLFCTPDIYAVKECGFWGGDEDRFYVATRTNIVGQNLARFQERGHYEWVIQFPNKLAGNEFKNTPIQALLDYLVAQDKSEFVVPLDSSISVSFTKEEKQIIARLQYK